MILDLIEGGKKNPETKDSTNALIPISQMKTLREVSMIKSLH